MLLARVGARTDSTTRSADGGAWPISAHAHWYSTRLYAVCAEGFALQCFSFEESSVSVEEYSTNRGVAGLGFRGLPTGRLLGPIVSTTGLAPEELEPVAMQPADALKQSSSERCIP